jgi:hypothetical protein
MQSSTPLTYNDVRAGIDPLTLFITFNIYVMNVLAFLTSISFHYHLWFYCNKSFTIPGFDIIQHSSELRVWSFDILDLRLFLIAHWIVRNKGTSTQCSSFCAQFILQKAVRGSLDIVLKPTKWTVVPVKGGRSQIYHGFSLSSTSWGLISEATWQATITVESVETHLIMIVYVITNFT